MRAGLLAAAETNPSGTVVLLSDGIGTDVAGSSSDFLEKLTTEVLTQILPDRRSALANVKMHTVGLFEYDASARLYDRLGVRFEQRQGEKPFALGRLLQQAAADWHGNFVGYLVEQQ
jgi:hypothetical protein